MSHCQPFWGEVLALLEVLKNQNDPSQKTATCKSPNQCRFFLSLSANYKVGRIGARRNRTHDLSVWTVRPPPPSEHAKEESLMSYADQILSTWVVTWLRGSFVPSSPILGIFIKMATASSFLFRSDSVRARLRWATEEKIRMTSQQLWKMNFG